ARHGRRGVFVLDVDIPPFARAFFCHGTGPPELYPLSLHDALPISGAAAARSAPALLPPAPSSEDGLAARDAEDRARDVARLGHRSEEHTSELQSRENLVCRLLLEKKHAPDVSGEQVHIAAHTVALP